MPDFPESLKTLVEHLIISHHGQYDFGSPKLPMFPEALMLHYLDDLDSKMEAMRAQFERGGESEGGWTGLQSVAGPAVAEYRQVSGGENVGSGIEEIGRRPPASASDKGADRWTPLPCRPRNLRTGACERKSDAAMTSAAHKDKI